jgi:hypothetical protein
MRSAVLWTFVGVAKITVAVWLYARGDVRWGPTLIASGLVVMATAWDREIARRRIQRQRVAE